MIITWELKLNRFILHFSPETDDQLSNLKTGSGTTYGMARDTCFFDLPHDWSPEETHPDLLAAAIILIIEPYSKSRIQLPKLVSQFFHDIFKTIYNKEVLPVDPNLKTRIPTSSSRPGLAFSGGVDSVTAAIILPKTTCCIFVNRVAEHPIKRDLYNKSAALHAMNEMTRLGHDVHTIPTDYEYVREPVGFGWGISSATPSLLLADYFDLDSIAFGMILESAYGIGDSTFREPNHTWKSLMEAAGINYNMVTAGLSEVGTTKFLLGFPEYYDFAQSCIRGEPGKPCLRCMKCFRKLLVEKAINNENLENFDLENKMTIPEIFKQIIKIPIHHENVYSFALASYWGEAKLLNLFCKKIRSHSKDLNWCSKWYSPSKNLIYSKYKDECVKNICKQITPMNPQEEHELKTWSPHSLLSSPWRLSTFLYKGNSKRFKRVLSSKFEKQKHLQKKLNAELKTHLPAKI